MNLYNLTAGEINALSDQEAGDLLTDLATKLCGSDRWATDLATQLGVTRQTVQLWKGGVRRPPDLALVALAAMNDRNTLRAALDNLASAIGAVTQLSGR